jgi:uncharacterized membrane-anchored protein YhcB (DUF1043 family)
LPANEEMKPPHTLSMGPLVPTLAILLSTALAVTVQFDSTSAKTSVDQIRDTLRNLLRSIDDAGAESESLFKKRQAWCDGMIGKFEAANQVSSANLADMKSQLTEHEAEEEEAAGAVQQIKVDIEMVEHTIKQTEGVFAEGDSLTQSSGGADVNLLQSLVDNKKLSLLSLQGQLEVSIPVLAQLQASVAEMKQRISYRTDSMATAKEFISALKDGCQSGADRADAQAAAQMGEVNNIHATLQALDSMEVKHDEPHDGQVSPLSFVQTQEVTMDDLTDLFNERPSAPAAPAPVVKRAPPSRKHSHHSQTASSLKPRIATMLSQLKAAGIAASDKANWCSKQREDSALALKCAKDEVAQLGSELEAHVASEAELAEELKRSQDLTATLTATSNSVLDFAKKEQSLFQSTAKDQKLATKILEQATTILKEIDVANTTQAIAGLQAAQRVLDAQVKAATGFEEEASAKARNVAQKAGEFLKTQANEEHNLEFSRDDHAAQRSRGVNAKRMYEASVNEATKYVQKLEESCKTDSVGYAEQQRAVQVRALEDATSALDGKLVKSRATMNKLRGVDAQPKTTENLTPMQRAAAEMGVSIE